MKKMLILLLAPLVIGAGPGENVDMAEMMKRAKALTSPGENHRLLERFIGSWTTETSIIMPGTPSKKEKGVVKVSWLMKGRWLKFEGTGKMMGMSISTFEIMGYDNMKKSFVWSLVHDMDTALRTAEGDMDPGGKALLMYGTLDEYLTGEHDKMVKYVWRFPSRDKMVLEVHDLPIGEKNTKVIEMTYRRKK